MSEIQITRFTQQSIEADALTSIADNPLAMKIYLFIVRKMNRKNALVASYRFFMDSFKASKTTVWRAVRRIESENLLQIIRCGGTVAFLPNPNIFWKGNDNQTSPYSEDEFNQTIYREVKGAVVFTESEWGDDDD